MKVKHSGLHKELASQEMRKEKEGIQKANEEPEEEEER